MTLEQQLQDFASNPVAGGVKWEAHSEWKRKHGQWGFSTKIQSVYIDVCLRDTGIHLVIILGQGAHVLRSKSPTKACEEAIQFVKQRAKEIYETLGGLTAQPPKTEN